MKNRIFIFLLALTFLLASCGGMTPIVPTLAAPLTPTSTLAPTILLSPTATPSPMVSPTSTKSPFPTTIEWATAMGFETMMASVCSTTTPRGEESTFALLSDESIQREFAGSYSYGTGFWFYGLVLNCDGTFREEIITDFGSRMYTQGIYFARNGQIILDGKLEDGDVYTVTFIPVRWGQRKYLIEIGRSEDFCRISKSTGSRKEPRKAGDIGYYYLRLGDANLDVIGFPISPLGDKICPKYSY